jgi:hypothetical protein
MAKTVGRWLRAGGGQQGAIASATVFFKDQGGLSTKILGTSPAWLWLSQFREATNPSSSISAAVTARTGKNLRAVPDIYG